MTIEVKDFDEREWLIERVEQLEEQNMSLEKRTYAAPHVWNLVAKVLREHYPIAENYSEPWREFLAQRAMVTNLALAFAKRFNEDEGFDPVTWLDKCSPNPDAYPFSELWEDV